MLAGCSSSKGPSNQDDSAFTYLLDRKPEWTENKVENLPPLPQASNLLAFNVSQNTPLIFSIDKTSISVGTDGVVRYTVVVTSPAGARNVNYEGIRCDNYEWRLYASINDEQNALGPHGRQRLPAHRERRVERVSRGAVSGLLLHEQDADGLGQARSSTRSSTSDPQSFAVSVT